MALQTGGVRLEQEELPPESLGKLSVLILGGSVSKWRSILLAEHLVPGKESHTGQPLLA